MTYLAGISLYPIKSLPPVSVPHARIAENGGLEGDRVLAFFDSEGRVINGKRTPLVHGLRASVDFRDGTVILREGVGRPGVCFHLHRERDALEAWLSEYFGMAVTLRHNPQGGFPDDANAPGPTVIGQATLEEVTSWYGGLRVSEARIRFRANLEIAGAPAFWEDRLFADAGEVVRFAVGDVVLEGTNPCQRCIVPTRDTRTGAQDADFAQVFRARREETLPPWANRARFNHFYRLAINTIVPASEWGKMVRVGDAVRVL